MTYLAAITLLLCQGSEAPADVRRALKRIEGGEAQAKDRMTAGLYYLSIRDYAAAIDHLAKSPEGPLRAAATREAELAGPGIKDPKVLVAAGDLWLEALKKTPKFAPQIRDRALHWYGEAWLRQTPEERGELRRLFASISPVPPGFGKPTGGNPSGWHPFGGAWRTSVDGRFAKEGRASAKLLPTQDPATNGFSSIQSLQVPAVEGREYAMACWVYSYDTDAAGVVELRFFDAQGNGIRGFTAAILADCPFWRRLEVRAQAPAGAVSVAVDCRAKFSIGAIWVDEISVTCGGRDVMQNGSFEKR